ncbi:MAG: hypothetical protein Unbinned4264contig1000_1 [Prokaryotic dsDNA virus sp.]|nr:MAG: hypothetical protein Unbinned4264contig1000_1 [Prokaryotic dsDNA virus sp.]|tara:strand:+ start:408 stop:746 length:339 start_codon:yes stop_codon:yes gene_type:complete
MKIKDLNKPTKCSFTGKYLDNTKVIAKEWILKPTLQQVASTRYDGYGCIENCIDYKRVGSEVVVVGTELQLYRLFCHMLKNYAWQLRDSFRIKVKEWQIEEYNNNNKIPVIL